MMYVARAAARQSIGAGQASRQARSQQRDAIILASLRSRAGAAGRRAYVTPTALPPGSPPPLLPPPPPPRSSFRRFLTYTTLSLALAYGASTYAALTNRRFGDIFVEYVPGGSKVLDVVEETSVGQKIKTSNASEIANSAVEVASSSYERLSGAVERVVGTAKERVEDLKESGKEALDSDNVKETGRRASEMVRKVERKVEHAGKEGQEMYENAKARTEKKVDDVRARGSQAAKEARAQGNEGAYKASRKTEKATAQAEKAYEEAKAKGGKALDDFIKKSEKTYDDVKAKGEKTYDDVKAKGEKLLDKARAQLEADTGRSFSHGETGITGREIPVNHESPMGLVGPGAGERRLTADTSHQGRLRDPPELPKLPKLAPTLTSLSGSEPMIAQLAGTIDDLAAFVREAPQHTGIRATGVLDEAKRELSRLYERLEEVKKNEAAKLQRGLEQQKQRYDAALQRAADDAQAKIGKVDEAYQKKQDELRRREAADYAAKLKTELETQSQIINERLREEVVQQGVEMQRRWMREIKARVEAERGGRLAKLDELAKSLTDIQKISLDNSQALEESAGTLALGAALRELSSVALQEADEVGTKRSFQKQLDLVKRAAETNKALADDELLRTSITALESAKPEQGVESYSTLYTWFAQKVRPAVQRVALVPDHAGVLSHMLSATFAPLLFTKTGYPDDKDQTDVPSVLARAQFHLERRDLDGATRQLNQLKGWPKVLAEDWLNAARRRLEVEQHLEVAGTQAHYASLQNA